MAQASFNTDHFPTPFKTTTTIIFANLASQITQTESIYRPITLENALRKVLESAIAELLSYITETHELLPPQHYGGRPGRTSEDAMIILSEKIHEAWKHGEIFTAVFMDVTGVFNNVHHE